MTIQTTAKKVRPSSRFRYDRALRAVVACFLVMSMAGCGGSGDDTMPSNSSLSTPTPTPTPAPTPTPTGAIVVMPMTTVNAAAGTGYFTGPYPITLANQSGLTSPRLFSGTTRAVLSCPGLVTAGCYTATNFDVDLTSLKAQATASGSTVNGLENNNIFQDDSGRWHMVTSLFVTNPNYPAAGSWHVLVHATPTVQTAAAVPTSWVGDTILIGSLATPGEANYDGKYYENAGQLYLLYSRRLSENPGRDGIAAQAMISPTQLAASAPVTMLAPTDDNGGYNSEKKQVDSGTLKLIETGNITVINGKFAMAYSVGTFNQTNYKAGIAWSDTFLPAAGGQYRKIIEQDTAGVWGQPSHAEVRYLLQAQIAQWPNYVAAQVLAPGVSSIAKDIDGSWYMFFNGFDPSDAPTDAATGNFQSGHKRSYFVRLTVKVPTSSTVAGTSDADLATWVSP